MKKIIVKNVEINLTGIQDDDYWSLTDIAKFDNETDPRYPIQNWMRLKDTLLFLGVWESLYNPNFNRVEFDAVVKEASQNRFVMTPTKWIRCTKGIGIRTKFGNRNGGTFAHRDIACSVIFSNRPIPKNK